MEALYPVYRVKNKLAKNFQEKCKTNEEYFLNKIVPSENIVKHIADLASEDSSRLGLTLAVLALSINPWCPGDENKKTEEKNGGE